MEKDRVVIFTSSPEIIFRYMHRRVQKAAENSGDLRFDLTWTSPYSHFMRYEAGALFEFVEANAKKTERGPDPKFSQVRLIYTASSGYKYAIAPEYYINKILTDRHQNYAIRIAPLEADRHRLLPYYPLELFILDDHVFSALWWSTDQTQVNPAFIIPDPGSRSNTQAALKEFYEQFFNAIPESLRAVEPGRYSANVNVEAKMKQLGESVGRLWKNRHFSIVDTTPEFQSFRLEPNWKAHLHYLKADLFYDSAEYFEMIAARNTGNEIRLSLLGDPAQDIPALLAHHAAILSSRKARILLGIGTNEDVNQARELVRLLASQYDLESEIQVAFIPIQLYDNNRQVIIPDIYVESGQNSGVYISSSYKDKQFFGLLTGNYNVETSLSASFDQLWTSHTQLHKWQLGPMAEKLLISNRDHILPVFNLLEQWAQQPQLELP